MIKSLSFLQGHATWIVSWLITLVTLLCLKMLQTIVLQLASFIFLLDIMYLCISEGRASLGDGGISTHAHALMSFVKVPFRNDGTTLQYIYVASRSHQSYLILRNLVWAVFFEYCT